MARLIERLARRGVRRGVERSSSWDLIRGVRQEGAAVTVLLVVLRAVHLIVAERPVSATVELKAGEAVEIRVLDPPPH